MSTVANETTKTVGAPHRITRPLDYMDGLRGVLVLGVLFLHIFFAVTLVHGPMPWYNWTQLWFQPGMYTVGLFVVISGYCLMLPVAKSPDGSLSGGIKGYVRRRFRRIVPPYYVAALLSLAHITFFPNVYTKYYGIGVNPWHAGVLWSHLLLFFNFRQEWRFQINSPYWSLAPEWQLYLLFPIVLVPIWRRFGLRVFLALCLAVTCALTLAGPVVAQMHPWFLLLFAAGMSGAVAANWTDPKWTERRDRVPWGVISTTLFGLFGLEWMGVIRYRPQLLTNLPPTWQQYVVNEDLLGIALLCAILHWNIVQKKLPATEWPLILRGLNHKTIQWLGRFSYSHYLVHWPIVISVVSVIRSLGMKEAPTLVLSYLIAAPVSISLGYLFFLGVERRFLPQYEKKTQSQRMVNLDGTDPAQQLPPGIAT